MYNVFISYLREDKQQVLRLAAELRSNGADVWVDVSDLLTGTPWREEIADAIRQSEFFLACFSSTYEARPANGMLDELNFVTELRNGGQTYPEILPIKLDACNIPDIPIDAGRNLNELQWSLLAGGDWEAGVKQLVEITLRVAKKRARARLKAEAREVVEKNSQAVRAREELAAHDLRVIRQQTINTYSQQNSMAYRGFQPPDVWPAQACAVKEMELKQAQSKYGAHQVEFVQRFGEEYHPLGEFSDEMDEEAKRIRKSFEDAQTAEDASMESAMSGFAVMLLIFGLAVIVLVVILRWLRSMLPF